MKITHDVLVSFLIWTSVFVVGVLFSGIVFRLAFTGVMTGYHLLSR